MCRARILYTCGQQSACRVDEKQKNGLMDDFLDVTLKQRVAGKTKTSLFDTTHGFLKRRVAGQDQKKLDVITNDVLKKARRVVMVQELMQELMQLSASSDSPGRPLTSNHIFLPDIHGCLTF